MGSRTRKRLERKVKTQKWIPNPDHHKDKMIAAMILRRAGVKGLTLRDIADEGFEGSLVVASNVLRALGRRGGAYIQHGRWYDSKIAKETKLCIESPTSDETSPVGSGT